MHLQPILEALPFAQAGAESWLVKWASPFFLLGLGILLGLVALALFVLIVRLLSNIPVWERLTRTPAGHVVAAIITALFAGGSWMLIRHYGFNDGWVLLFGNAEATVAGQAVSRVEPISAGGIDIERTLVFLATLLLCAIVGWAVVFCAGRKSADTLFATLTEGASSVLALVVIMTMGIGLLSGLVFTDPMAALTSVPRLFQTGTYQEVRVIPGLPANVSPDEAPLVPAELQLDATLLTSLKIRTDRSIVLGDAEESSLFETAPRKLQADEEITWNRKDGQVPPIPVNNNRILHIQNREVDDATVTITVSTTPAVPESATILITAIIVFLTAVAILLQQAIAPRASAVALATVKNELAQPLFAVLLLLGAVLIILFEFLSFYTFGEDIKLLKECGIVVIMLLAAFQGIWSASSSISEEIEGRTALTVLSKPIQRRSFVLGKFLGIFWIVALLFIILGALELGAVAYKPIYEARENSLEMPTWQECHREMVSTVPGLVLGLLQATVLSSISVALATRLPQLANIAVCFGVYVVGHLATAIVSGANEGFAIVKFVAQLVSTVIPILEHFQMQAAIDAGSPITMSLLSGTLIYCLLYILLSMFLALLLFEDRDLA